MPKLFPNGITADPLEVLNTSGTFPVEFGVPSGVRPVVHAPKWQARASLRGIRLPLAMEIMA
jgi:hypothetical protein